MFRATSSYSHPIVETLHIVLGFVIYKSFLRIVLWCDRAWIHSNKVKVSVLIAVLVGVVIMLAAVASLAYWYFAKYRNRDQVKYNNLGEVERNEDETLVGGDQQTLIGDEQL